MKKLIFIFLVFMTLVIVAGCNSRQNTVNFEDEKQGSEEVSDDSGVTTTITKLDDEEEEDTPLAVMPNEGSVDVDNETPLAVTSMEENTLTTNVGYQVVRGTTPRHTHKLKVNDYVLQKYTPGQTRWNYIASASMGTLEAGTNTYNIVATDVFGNVIDSTRFTINYSEPEIPNLPSTGPGLWFSLFVGLMSSAYFFFRRRLVS